MRLLFGYIILLFVATGRCVAQSSQRDSMMSLGKEVENQDWQHNKKENEIQQRFMQAVEYLKHEDYKNATDCLEQILPSLNSPQDIIRCYSFLVSSYAMYDAEKAHTSLNQYYHTVKTSLLPYIFKNSTEFERQRLWKMISLSLSQLSMKTALSCPKSEAIINAYDIIQLLKNLETETVGYLRKAKKNGELDEWTQRFFQWYNQKRDSLYFGDIQDTNHIGHLEQLELNKRLVNDKINTDDILKGIRSFKDVSRRLKNKASLIEYNVYIDLQGKKRYAAIVINTEKESPAFIDLCSVDEASKLLSKDAETVNEIYSNDRLYSTFFSKVEPFLLHDTVVVCPVGMLEAVNFDAIYHKGKRLMDRYTFLRTYSGHSFFKWVETKHHGRRQAVLYGGIAYSKEQTKESEYADKHFKLSRGEHIERGSLRYLQYSSEEIAHIRDILEKSDFKTTALTGLEASESSFYQLDGNAPSILHIATHGFFISEDEDVENHSFFNNLNIYQDYKLLRSGVFLANANEAWKGKMPHATNDDGILTAYEISKLDLSNVMLVVLSACETANGFVDNIEGTQGLQYAFKQAGAGNMLLSLWEIDDAVTFLFMNEFYSSLVSQNNMQKAYQSALRKVMAEYPEPSAWAGFIFIYN